MDASTVAPSSLYDTVRPFSPSDTTSESGSSAFAFSLQAAISSSVARAMPSASAYLAKPVTVGAALPSLEYDAIAAAISRRSLAALAGIAIDAVAIPADMASAAMMHAHRIFTFALCGAFLMADAISDAYSP